MKIFFFFLFLFIHQSLAAQDQRELKWKSDIEFLKKELPKKHINLFAIKNKSYFIQALDDVAANVKSFDDFEIAVRLQQVIALFGDSHTQIDFRKLIAINKKFPIKLHWLSDGIYIVQALPEYEILLGNKILRINNIGIQTIIDSLSTLLTADNSAIQKRDIPDLICTYQLLDYFNFIIDGKIYLDLWDHRHNDTITHQLLVMSNNNSNHKNNFFKIKQDTTPVNAVNAEKLFADQYFPEDRMYYIQYNRCWSKELETQYGKQEAADKLPSFTAFEERVLNVLNKENISKLIFDLRRNSGGSSAQGSGLIKKICGIEKVKDSINIYVLIGRYTYSSALINALDFKKYLHVTYVGEETSGKPNHFGEIKYFLLPNSGIPVSYSTKYFKMYPGNEPTIRPDIPFSLSISDIEKGSDPSFEWVRSQ